MPRAGDPRITVRFSPEEWEALERAAKVRRVTNAGMVRECVARWAAWAASDPAGQKVRMRRRSSPVPVPAASAEIAGMAEQAGRSLMISTAGDPPAPPEQHRDFRSEWPSEPERVPSGPPPPGPSLIDLLRAS